MHGERGSVEIVRNTDFVFFFLVLLVKVILLKILAILS